MRTAEPKKKLDISIEHRDGYPVVSVVGEIDLYTASEFQEALSDVSKDARVLILDLSRISYVDSAGLSLFLAMHKQLSSRGAALYIVAPPNIPGVSRVIEVTRLDSLIPVRPTVDDVLKELHVQEAA